MSIPKIGIEVEFKTTKKGYEKFRKNFLGKHEGVYHHWGFRAVREHCRLMEVNSDPLSLDEFTHEGLIQYRLFIADTFASMDIPYLYYGFHISLWDFDESDETIGAVEAFPSINRLIATVPRFMKENIYADPFLDSDIEPRHSIINVTLDEIPEAKRNGVVWRPGRDAVRRIFGAKGRSLLDLLNCGPVQGGALRIEPRHRVEFVLGWIEPEVERVVIDRFLASVLDKDTPESDPPEEAYMIFSQKKRVGVVLLNQHSFPGMSPRTVDLNNKLIKNMAAPFDDL